MNKTKKKDVPEEYQMTNDEFTELILTIKSNYTNFELSDPQMKWWKEFLLPYDFKDIKKSLEYHLEGEYGDRIPKPYWLTKRCLTQEEKANKKKTFMICPFCKKKYEFPIDKQKWNKCYERCSSIDYILMMSKRLNLNYIEIFNGNIKTMKLSEINEKYIHFIEEVYSHKEKLTEDENKYLLNVLKTSPVKLRNEIKINV